MIFSKISISNLEDLRLSPIDLSTRTFKKYLLTHTKAYQSIQVNSLLTKLVHTLEILDLSECNLYFSDLKYLNICYRLKSLNLSRNKISIKNKHGLFDNLTKLEKLDLSGNNLKKIDHKFIQVGMFKS